MSDENITLAFDLIRQYAEHQGWIPIGFRSFDVGPWHITVNGTPTEDQNIPPWHALIMHRDIVAFLMLHPMGGVSGGWEDAEHEFIRQMEAAVRRPVMKIVRKQPK